jgi:isopropylmalate/homocitrate/citramalate synthase
MSVPSSPQGRAEVDKLLALSQSKLNYLNQLNPMLIDISLREPCFASPIGHTLTNKLDILPMVDEFGAKEKIIATLDYQFPEHPQVEDDFCLYLLETGYDMTGCYAMTAVGDIQDGKFIPTLSMEKLVAYKIPNTVHEITLLPKQDPDRVLASLSASIDWLRQNVQGEKGGTCRIYMNVLDLVDTLMIDRAWACQVLELLAIKNVEAVSFEDDRGTFFPFQIAATVGCAKAMLNPSQKVLFHAHTGNGMENASVLEALLHGADGYWAGMERESSTIGHASLGELIANLVRAGNPHMAENYKLDRLLPICHAMHRINTEEEPPETWPIEGSDAYRTVLSFFEQKAGWPMDLPPEQLGERYSYRIAPVGSDIPVLQGRYKEIGMIIDEDLAKTMILIMRRDLRAGIRLRYDEPEQMRELYLRATS